MKKASEVLGNIIKNLVSDNEFVNVYIEWKSMLEPEFSDIVMHSEPVDMRNDALFLYVDHPGWAQRIEFHKQKILNILHTKYPQIKNLYIKHVSNEKLLERREQKVLGNYE